MIKYTRNRVSRTCISVMLALLSIQWSGCVFVFAPKRQKVTFATSTPGATIKYNEDSIGVGTAKKKLNRGDIFHTVIVDKKGYVTRSYPIELKAKLSAGALFSVLDFATAFLALIIIPIDLGSPKAHRFDKQHTIPPLIPLAPKKDDEKYMLVNKTSLNAQSKDLQMVTYKKLKQYANRSGYLSDESFGKGGANIDNTVFTDELNATLLDMGFVDTSHSIFTSADNSLYLDANITSVTIHSLKRRHKSLQAEYGNELVGVELAIEWKVMDYYKQSIYTTTTKKVSDLFLISNDNEYIGSRSNSFQIRLSNPIKQAVAQNFKLALVDVREEISRKGLLKKGTGEQEKTDEIAIARPQAPGDGARLNEMLKACVSIKVDKGHGSGVVISDDGYIVTNYHVVTGTDKIEVIFNDDSHAIARVIKASTGYDLALLKVDKDSLKALPLTDNKTPDIGIDVWAMGTPNSLELGQSISKGIISGFRTTNDLSYIQTDVKVSPGNSGGALINRRGDILGVVASKLIGQGTEGVSFAIPAYEVLEKLNIRYR